MKLLILLLTGALVACTLFGCGFGKTKVQTDVHLIEIDKHQLVANATAIVAGEVIASESQDDFRNFPVTDYKIKVTNVYKGNPRAEVEVRTAGGENRKMIVEPDEKMVSFEVGEHVVVFLTDDKGDRPDQNDFGYYVVGQYQGKFKEESGKLKNEKFSFDKINFETDLKDIENENKDL